MPIVWLAAGILLAAAELMTGDQAVGIYLAEYAIYLKILFVAAVLGIGYTINHSKRSDSL